MSTRRRLALPIPTRERTRIILVLALPIVGGMVSQNVLNLVDTAMVGTLGDASLAAVGLGSMANFLATAFVTGLAAGVQAMSARRHGEGRYDVQAVPLNGGLLLAIVLAVPLSVLAREVAPTLFPLLVDDPAVVAEGVPYLRVRLLAMTFVSMNFAFRGYWNGVNRSVLYLSTLVVMHVANIALNWVLIFGHLGAPALGSYGAGVASAIAIGLGTLTYIGLGLVHARGSAFLGGLPELDTMRTMLRLSVPAGLQQLFLAAGFTALFAIVGMVGTSELAAANVLINLTLTAYLPAIGLGLAAASLVGQALGRGDVDDARRWGWEVTALGAVLLTVIGIPGLLWPELMLRVFLHDPETVALAVTPLRLVAGLIGVEALVMVLVNALQGAGATRQTMVISVLGQWALQLPLAWLAGPVLGFGLTGIWACLVLSRVVQAVAFAVIWQRGRWAGIAV